MNKHIPLVFAFILSVLLAPVALAEEVPSVSTAYKKLSLADQSIDVIYAELPETVYVLDKVLKVRGGSSRMTCAGPMGQALQKAGYQAESSTSSGIGDFSCEAIFSGTGKSFDDWMQKIKEAESSPLFLALKGLSVLTQVAKLATGIQGMAAGHGALGAGMATADVSMAQPNVATARIAEASAQNGRLFGDDEPAMVTRICAKGAGNCVFVTVILHKASQDKTKDDSANMVEALKTGFVLTANVIKADS